MPEIEYIWDELSDNVIEEYEDGVLSVSYDHEPGLYGNLLSQNRNGVTSYYHYDGRGDTVALTDDSGNVTDTKEYDAWGNVIASTGSTITPYRFIGRKGYQTGHTGVYVRARMYLPTPARWLAFDRNPAEQLRSQYSYVNNSSPNMVDASGLEGSWEPMWPHGRPAPESWTCDSARAKILKLRDKWNELGYTLSVSLLDLFLAGKGGNSIPVQHPDQCSSFISDYRFVSELTTYAKSFSNKTCTGKRQIPDVMPTASNPSWPAFDIEFLPTSELAIDILNGEFDRLGDWAYAVGTARFGHSNLVIEYEKITKENTFDHVGYGTVRVRSCCCQAHVRGRIVMQDTFNFGAEGLRAAVSSYYSAGNFLQTKCKGYKSVLWQVQCDLDVKVNTRCETTAFGTTHIN